MSGQINIYGGNRDPEVAPEIQMLRLASGHIPAQAVYVFASLGIADILHDAPKPANEIADLVGAHAPTLYRLLRFLSTLDVVAELDNEQFALTALGSTLRRQGVAVVRDNALLSSSTYLWKSLGSLLDLVTTGRNTFHRASYFEYLGSHPEDAALFNKSMDSLSKLNVPSILGAYDFSGCSRIVDVGGGKGALLTGILKRYPSAHGVLFDEATVVESVVVDRAIADRFDRVAGDLFGSIPAGGDTYIIKQVLHNWDDEKVIGILRQCRSVIPDNGRLLIIEMAAPEAKNNGNNWAALDVLMLLMQGRERTQEELGSMLREVGFSVSRTVSTTSRLNVLDIIEAKPA